MSNRLVADTIAQQLGGYGRLESMIRAKGFVAGEDDLTFKFSGKRNINTIRIALNDSDTYNVSFYNIKKLDYELVLMLFDIHAEELKSTIERVIGLCLSLSA